MDQPVTIDGKPVQAAINQALATEQAALAAIAKCEEQAAQLVLAARQTARTIAQRADRRISRIHQAGETPVTAAEPPAFTPPVVELEQAVARLAARLTGGAQ